LNLFGSGT